MVSIACPNLVSARYWVHCSYISNRFKKLTADEANKSRTSGFFFSRLSLSQISGTYAIIRSMLLDWTVELPSFGTEICKGTFFASSLRSFHVLSGSLPSANARGVFADYGRNRILSKLLPVRVIDTGGREVGRRTVSKEQEIRDGRYRAAACSEFSELSVFLFLKPAASIFSARVHVASKDLQTTDL